MRLLIGAAVMTAGLLFTLNISRSDDLKKCYHYHYDDHGHVVVIEVLHDIHHPHVLLGYGHFFIDTVLFHSRWHHHPGHYISFRPHHRIHGFPHRSHHGKKHIKVRKKHIDKHNYDKVRRIIHPGAH